MTIQDNVLKEDWIVACKATDVNKEPIQIMMMDERLVLFRTEKGVHAFKDLCIHRGARMSHGEVRNGCIVCPYHAWEFDHTGQCTKIPQLPEDREIPLKAKLIPYPCIEKYGFIWVNLAGNEPKMFDYPEFHFPAYRNVIWGPQEVNAKPPRIIENFLDVGHLATVHVNYLGVETHMEIGDYKVHDDENGIRSDEISVFQPDPDGSGVAKTVNYTYEIYRPLTVRFTKREPETNQKMAILLTLLPVSDNKTIAYGVLSFNYETYTTDEEIIQFQDMIFSQDKPIVENQKPEDLPLDLQVELSLKCDRVSIAYRKYLQQLGVTFGTK